MNGAALTQTRLLSLAFTVSFGVNLFIAGWLLSGGSIGFRHGFPGREAFREELYSSLSKQAATDVVGAIDQIHNEFDMRLVARSRRDINSQLLTTDPFNRAAFLKEREELRAAFQDAMTKSDEIVATVIERLPAQDRHKLATLRLPPPFGDFGGRPPR